MGAISNNFLPGGGVGNSYDSTSSMNSAGSGNSNNGGGGRGRGSNMNTGVAGPNGVLGQSRTSVGNRGGQNVVYNPYLQGNQGVNSNPSGQHERGVNSGRGSGTGHFNAQVERRSQENTMIFTPNSNTNNK